MEKEQPLLTIGEIAKMLGLTRRIIINYEDHGLIQPDTRGEFDKGYRYYTIDTLVRIRTIRTFQNLGLSLEEIKEYFNDNTDLTPALRRLEALRVELDISIERLRDRIQDDTKPAIHVAEVPAYTVCCQTLRSTCIAQRTEHLRQVAYKAVSSYGVDISRRMYFTRFSVDDPELVTCCAVVPSASKGPDIAKLPSVKVLARYHHGTYESLPAVREELMEHARVHNIPLTGECRHIYLEGPPQHKDPRRFITIVALVMDE